MDAVVDSVDFFHDFFLPDLSALLSSLLDSTVNIAKFSEKVHEIAQHTKNPEKLLKLWGEIKTTLDAKKKPRSSVTRENIDLHRDSAIEENKELLIKLRELKHETHRIFAADNFKNGLTNKLLILTPIFGTAVVLSDFLTYALPVLRPVFFGFGMHLAYKANKESHKKGAHDNLTYSEIVAKHDKSHKWAMGEIASVLTIYTAGLPREQQAIILGGLSTAMVGFDLMTMAIPRLELLGDRLAVSGGNPATRLVGRSLQQSGEFLIEKAFPRAAFVAEYILAGRAITHSSLFLEKGLDEGQKYLRENFGVILEYITNLGTTGLVGFAMSPVATAFTKNVLVPIHKRLEKTELWCAAHMASKAICTNMLNKKQKIQSTTRNIFMHMQDVPTLFQNAMAITKRTMQNKSQRIINDARNFSYASLVNTMIITGPRDVSAPQSDRFSLAHRPAYYTPIEPSLAISPA